PANALTFTWGADDAESGAATSPLARKFPQMSWRRATWLVGCLLAALAPSMWASAADVQASAAIARLLEVGWANTLQARLAADEQYQQLLKLAGSDVQAISASWLVLMHQRRYEDAGKRIEQ